MKKLIILLFFISFNSYSFFGLFEEKRPNPFNLNDETKQMEYLKKYHPNSYERILKYKQDFSELQELDDDIVNTEKEWDEYEKYSGKMYDEAKELRKKLEVKKRKKLALEQKVKSMEKEILSKYKVVNGKLVEKKEERKKKKKEEEDKILRERIIEFQKERGLPVLKEDQDIKVKRE